MLDKILLRVYDANTKLLLKVKQDVNYFYSLFCRMNTQWQGVQVNGYQSNKKEGDSSLEEKEMDKKGMSWMQVIQSRVYKRGM